MVANLQLIILQKLVNDEQFCRKVLPFIKPEYFFGGHKAVYKIVLDFIAKYNKLPNVTALSIEVDAADLAEDVYPEASKTIELLGADAAVEPKWLLEQTEQWCKDRALTIAIAEACTIIEGKRKDVTNHAIPEILTKALGISFDTNVGHDYIDDATQRYDYYHKIEDRLPFDLEMFNAITKGGVPKKTLNIILAGTGVGKSLAMCHFAASFLSQGKNVLYITMEMSEERIAERIDANLMNVAIDQLETLPKQMYDSKMAKIAANTVGKLIIKEYPTSSAHAGHFRALLNELKLKKGFVPDVIFIDYINICASSRIKSLGGSVNSYTYIKAISEELRGLAVEFNLPIFSATQSTRSGFSNTDVEITDTSESFGLPATADFMFALISTEELEKLGQLMVKQLKNRYNDVVKNKRFVIGIDRSKMKLFDVENKAQNLMKEPTSRGGSAPVANPKRSFDQFIVE
jgi:replicative DNA helicase